MPRPPRIDRADGLYHVTSRGNGREKIFHTNSDRLRFLSQLEDNLDTYNCHLFAFVLMDNHFHLLIRTPEANLSRFMQRLVTSYAMYARYKHRKPGHQFQGRFKAKLIESDRYLRQVSRYIHLNPIRTKPCAKLSAKERLQKLNDYRWSSYRSYIGAHAADVPVIERELLKQFLKAPMEDDAPANAPGETASPDWAGARASYRRYVESCVLETDAVTLHAMHISAYVIGSDAYAQAIETELGKQRGADSPGAAPEDIALPRQQAAIESIVAAVAKYYGVDPALVTRHGLAAGDAKAAAVELACLLSGCTQRKIGQYFGGISTSAISKIRARIRRAAKNDALKRAIAEIRCTEFMTPRSNQPLTNADQR
ncbi:MAG: transposase [Candidatus Sumerlaeota bacterium]|nr:transposase [Candidatus Sumerlaeota bacterium]